jgi:hypothetical protein
MVSAVKTVFKSARRKGFALFLRMYLGVIYGLPETTAKSYGLYIGKAYDGYTRETETHCEIAANQLAAFIIHFHQQPLKASAFRIQHHRGIQVVSQFFRNTVAHMNHAPLVLSITYNIGACRFSFRLRG